MTALIANTRLVEVDYQSTCRPNDAAGWPIEGGCSELARYVACHLSSLSVSGGAGGSHSALCAKHAREQLARCLRNVCHGAS